MHAVIVESPTKARKLKEYLGDDFIIEASMGHVRDLPKSKLGVEVNDHFAPTYEPIRGASKTISKLKSLAKKADVLYLATDPDREGEAIAWHLLEAWNDPKLTAKSKRAVFHEITKDAILDAIAHPQKLNLDLVNAQQARRVLDRLVGYSLSPVLWKKIRRGLSAGRVQSVALRLIVDREEEISKFVPDEYWEIDVHVTTQEKEPLVARVTKLNDKKYDPKQESDVAPLRDWAPKATYTIAAVEEKNRSRSALPPFITSTLQQQAATRLGMTARRTMSLAQNLYEEGLITYHRTDSTNLSGSALAMAREYIAKVYGTDYVPEKPNFYSRKSKNAQEAHEAIRPTSTRSELPNGKKFTGSHAKLYDLIFRRFIASQMTSAKTLVTTATIRGEQGSQSLDARASGSVLLHPGWMRLFPGQDEVILPPLKEKQPLDFNKLQTVQKFTEPPPRFNDASLVKELEKRGIGRPSTYASIISVLLDRGYVERRDKAFLPMAVGTTVVHFLEKNFPEVLDYDFTAHMEDDLDEISLGKKEWQKIIKTFFGPFSTKLEDVEKNAQRMAVPVEPIGKPCPECGATEGGELVIRSGRFGRFISCSRFPECKYTASYHESINMECPKCGEGDVVKKKTKKGRTFYGCSRYPDCDFSSWKKPKASKSGAEEE